MQVLASQEGENLDTPPQKGNGIRLLADYELDLRKQVRIENSAAIHRRLSLFERWKGVLRSSAGKE